MDNKPATDNFYTSLGRLSRFLLRKGEYGFGFAVAKHQGLRKFVNDELVKKGANNGKRIQVIFTNPDADEPFITQLRNALVAEPAPDALIIPNIEEWLPLKDNESTETALNFLQELNFSREALQQLDIPLLFWISEATLSLIGNKAADLFSQRQISTVYFNDNPEQFKPDEALQNRFPQGLPDTGEAEQLTIKIALLKKQLEEAAIMGLPLTTRFYDIALPLALAYAQNGMSKQAVALLETYTPSLSFTEDGIIAADIADVYLADSQYSKAADLFSAAENC